MMPTSDSAASVDLVLFKIRGVDYAADASQVVRIDRAPRGAALEIDRRALVVRDSDGACYPIQCDAVPGLRTVPVAALRRLPAAIDASEIALGVWLDGDRPVLLVDLVEFLKRHGGQ
jgi:hypothetical protein